jgi:hypothetical protein
VNKTDKKDLYDQLRVMGLVRVALGAVLVLLPRLALRFWMGEEESDSNRLKAAARSLGARDVAIGVGQLTALDTGAPVRPWVEAAVLSDAADSANALLFMKDVPPLLRLAWIVIPGWYAWMGAQHAAELD